MSEDFLIRKEVDKSMLERGFAIPVSAQENFSFNLSGGRLAHGEKRDINIFLDGEFFTVKLSSSGFNREKYSAHSDQWQVLYPKTSPFANKIRKIFSAHKILSKKRREYARL